MQSNSLLSQVTEKFRLLGVGYNDTGPLFSLPAAKLEHSSL